MSPSPLVAEHKGVVGRKTLTPQSAAATDRSGDNSTSGAQRTLDGLPQPQLMNGLDGYALSCVALIGAVGESYWGHRILLLWE